MFLYDPFSQFDPLNYSIILMSPVLVFFLFMSKFSTSWNFNVMKTIVKVFNSKFSLFNNMLISIFFIFVFINFMGSLPFWFSCSSHIWFVMIFSILFYVLSIFVSFVNSHISFFSHFVPQGSPLMLAGPLFWIEVISSVVRPLTLSLRLCANMIADHVLLSLLSSMFAMLMLKSSIATLFLLPLGVFLILFVFFVCMIQAVVFSLLVNVYFEEI